jgi:hypothetical protein
MNAYNYLQSSCNKIFFNVVNLPEIKYILNIQI